MMPILIATMLFCSQVVLVKNNKVSCNFPNHSEQMTIDSCAEKMKDNSIKIESSVLKKIKFDEAGLAGGSIEKEGCYWLNKKVFPGRRIALITARAMSLRIAQRMRMEIGVTFRLFLIHRHFFFGHRIQICLVSCYGSRIKSHHRE